MNYSVRDAVSELVYADITRVAEMRLPWKKLEQKTILITGAAGFIGYYLVLGLLAHNDKKHTGIHVIGLVRNRERAEKKYRDLLKREDFSLVVQDVCQEIRIEEKADYVIHAASQASAWHFEHDPVGTIQANLAGTIQVLEYARRSKSEAVLVVSSLKTYGAVHTGQSELTEDTVGYLDHTSYKNCYAMGKRVAETLAVCYNKQYGMHCRIARPSYIYGPSTLEDDRVWAQFIANVVKKENILLKSNGGAYRSFCYVSDTAAALLTILLTGSDGVPYNISADHSNTTIRNFAKTAVEVFPERGLSLSFARKEDEQEPDVSLFDATPEILDASRLNELGWQAQVDLKQGIRNAVLIVESETQINGDKNVK